MKYYASANLNAVGLSVTTMPFSFNILTVPQLVIGTGTYTEMFKVQGSSPSGTGGEKLITIDFTYDIVFDNSTDMAGEAFVTSSSKLAWSGNGAYLISNLVDDKLGNTIKGKLNDYTLNTSLTFNCSFTHNAAPLTPNTVSTLSDTGSSGSITITYDYTPRPSLGTSSSIKDANHLDDLAQRPPASTGQADITGLWAVTQGTTKNHYIYMYQEAGKISGMWDDRFIITGSLKDNVYSGKYYTMVNPNGSAFTFTVSTDGNSFEGIYHQSIKDYSFSAVKDMGKTAQLTAAPTARTPSLGFAGTWGTTAGDIVLKVEGTKAGGTWGDKTVTGTVNGNVLIGRYYKTSEPEMLWDFNMTMKPDGKTCVLFHSKQGGVYINTWRK